MQTNLNDQALWAAFRKENDEKAFSLLFDRYWSRLFTTAYRYLKDRERAADIVHDVFLNLWQKGRELEIHSFEHYLLAATRYHTYRQLKKLRAGVVEYQGELEGLEGTQVQGGLRIPGEDEALVAAAATPSINSAEEKFRTEELEQMLQHRLKQLPRRCREIFVLSRLEHLSNDEISRRLQISKRSVENQLSFALRHFRAVMKHFLLCLLVFFF